MARAHVSAVTMPPAARRASPCGRMWYSFAPVWSQDVIEPREQQQALATLKTPVIVCVGGNPPCAAPGSIWATAPTTTAMSA